LPSSATSFVMVEMEFVPENFAAAVGCEETDL